MPRRRRSPAVAGTPHPQCQDEPSPHCYSRAVDRRRVASVNTAGRFVVLTFPLGTMPALEKRMSVYRSGLKVGE